MKFISKLLMLFGLGLIIYPFYLGFTAPKAESVADLWGATPSTGVSLSCFIGGFCVVFLGAKLLAFCNRNHV